jgi:hypothetical protein
MDNHRTARRMPTASLRPAAFWAAILIGAAAVGLWLRPADGPGWQAPLEAEGLALTVALGLAWRSRARSARRWQAALDAYAQREIARTRRTPAPPGLPTGSTPGRLRHGAKGRTRPARRTFPEQRRG